MTNRWRLLQWLAAIVVATSVAVTVVPGHRDVSLGAGVMTLLALFLFQMGSTAYRLAGTHRSAWERVRHAPERVVERPADLERIERGLGWGQYSVADFNYRVRPMLRRLAAQRLRESHGIDVDADPRPGRAVVSDELWASVIDKQPPESERVIRTADITRMVDEIEGL